MTNISDLFGVPDSDQDDQVSQVEARHQALTARLLDATELHKLDQPEPLIGDLLDRDSLCWLQGKPGHAKSFIALDLAGHIAIGRSWRGRDVCQGRVLYLVAEGATGVERRLHAWELGNRAHISYGVVTFLPVAVQLLNHIDVAAMVQVVKDIEPVLIVIDTQARVTVGGEENSSKDMGKFVEAADQLRQVCRSTVLIIHHESRGGENLRGSTAMEGSAGTVMRAKKDGPVIELICMKQKEGADFDTLYGSLAPAGESVYWSHDAVGLQQAETNAENAIYAVMRDLYGTTGASSTKLEAASGLAHSSYYRGLSSLVRKGILRNDGSKRATHYVLSDQDQEVPGT